MAVSHTVHSRNYSTRIKFLADDLQYVERVHHVKESLVTMDAFPFDWFLFISDMPRDSARLLSPEGPLGFPPPVAVFLPPFAIVHWRLAPGTVRWSAFRSSTTLPLALRTEIRAFPWRKDHRFSSAGEILNLVLNERPRTRVFPVERTASPLAREAKAVIDVEFSESLSMTGLGVRLKSSASNVSHQFSSCYGISPVQYRNHLRLHQSLRLLSWDRRNVTDSCFESGFEDFSRFFRQFKSAFGTNPSSFVLNERNRS